MEVVCMKRWKVETIFRMCGFIESSIAVLQYYGINKNISGETKAFKKSKLSNVSQTTFSGLFNHSAYYNK